jgi:hypothetical protein
MVDGITDCVAVNDRQGSIRSASITYCRFEIGRTALECAEDDLTKRVARTFAAGRGRLVYRFGQDTYRVQYRLVDECLAVGEVPVQC